MGLKESVVLASVMRLEIQHKGITPLLLGLMRVTAYKILIVLPLETMQDKINKEMEQVRELVQLLQLGLTLVPVYFQLDKIPTLLLLEMRQDNLPKAPTVLPLVQVQVILPKETVV